MLTRRQYKTVLDPGPTHTDCEFTDDHPKNASRIDKSLRKYKRTNLLAKRVNDLERLMSFSDEEEEEKTPLRRNRNRRVKFDRRIKVRVMSS